MTQENKDIEEIVEEYREKFPNGSVTDNSPPYEVETWLHQALHSIAKQQYEKGFIAGAEITGSQAEEIMAEKVEEAKTEELERIKNEIRDLDETFMELYPPTQESAIIHQRIDDILTS